MFGRSRAGTKLKGRLKFDREERGKVRVTHGVCSEARKGTCLKKGASFMQ